MPNRYKWRRYGSSTFDDQELCVVCSCILGFLDFDGGRSILDSCGILIVLIMTEIDGDAVLTIKRFDLQD
jgi:hypothetical protein